MASALSVGEQPSPVQNKVCSMSSAGVPLCPYMGTIISLSPLHVAVLAAKLSLILLKYDFYITRIRYLYVS